MSELNQTWKDLRPQIGAFLNQLDNLSKDMDKKMESAYRAGIADAWSMAQQILSMSEEEAERVFDDSEVAANVIDCSADEAAALLYDQANADYELAKCRRDAYGEMLTRMHFRSEAEKDAEKTQKIMEQLNKINKDFNDLADLTT